MSNLPAYQPVPKYDAHEHELPASPSGLTYPPESSARKHRTTYIFSYQSNDEKAVGLMGRNKQVSSLIQSVSNCLGVTTNQSNG